MTTTNPEVLIAVDDEGRAISRTVHLHEDCSALRNNKMRPISEQEQLLLGVRQCSICEKRRSGGPAIDALKELSLRMYQGHEDHGDNHEAQAWAIFNFLKDRGFYIARRTVKSEQ